MQAPRRPPDNEPSNPSVIRSDHLAAPGFSEHRIYWEEYGSLAGEPVIVMHGGPGAGSHSSSARFFNPQRYRVVLFDQRGCGKSTPSASDDDATLRPSTLSAAAPVPVPHEGLEDRFLSRSSSARMSSRSP